ncbi:MAG: SsrA-binding protein SmpB [Clostridia bacterium]|nr:SsrA-binding protein SmpB [Clostridia bacterium]MBQ1965415.1 SsrA-binding protein SmpB [Clostridia bacterium]
MKNASVKTIANNKKAYHDYFVEEKFEAGISLVGTEVKSIRQGKVNLKDSYCSIKNGEMMLLAAHISPYEKGNIFNKDPLRERKLLMHRKEIDRLFGKVKQDGYSIIPLQIYLKGPYVKVEIGLCKGKKLYDKRESAAQKSAKRDMERSMKIER